MQLHRTYPGVRLPLTSLLLFLVLCAIPSIAGGQVAPASSPQVWSLPVQGPPTTDLALQGIGFDPLTSIDLYFDDTALASTTTDNNGAFGNGVITAGGAALTRIQVPATALPGEHTITAKEHVGQKSAEKSFLVRTNWPRFGFDLQTTGLNPYENLLGPDNVASLTYSWANCYATYLWSTPAVADGVVYSGGWDGSICAADATTGASLWTVQTQNQAGSPAVVNGVVYVGADSVYALKASTGEIIWQFGGIDDFQSSPVVANGVVYIGGIFDNSLYALNATTGTQIWSFVTGAAIYGSPALADGIVYIGSGDGSVYALNATTGALVWQYATQGYVESSPAVADGIVYIGSFDNNVYALDAKTGALIWKYTTSSDNGIESSPAVANGVVYIGGSSYGNADVNALDAKTGALVWKFTAAGPVHASPTVANGVVYIGSENPGGYFCALDAKTGAVLWSFAGEILAAAPVVNGVVYVPYYGAVEAFILPQQQRNGTPSPARAIGAADRR